MIPKVAELNECCSVTDVRGGGASSGRKDSGLEKDNADIADDRLIVVPWLLATGMIRLGKRHSPRKAMLRSTCPTGTVYSKFVRRDAQATCQQRGIPRHMRELFGRPKEGSVARSLTFQYG